MPNEPHTTEEWPVISRYTREDAIADGTLVDMTEWASAEKGFIGGFACPVAMTRGAWSVVDIDARQRNTLDASTRGVAHDVLYLGSLALRAAIKRNDDRAKFVVKIGRNLCRFKIVADGDGVTILSPEED